MDDLKYFREKPQDLRLSCFVSGVGVKEVMKPCVVNRPSGTGDWLLMLFHNTVKIRDKNGVGVHSAGSCIIWSDSDAHHYGSVDGKWSHSWIHFQGGESHSIVESVGLRVNTVFNIGGVPEAVLNCLRGIYSELTEELASDDFIIGNFLRNIFAILGRRSGGGDSRYILTSGVAKAKKLMDADPSRRFTLKELAKAANLSTSHFSAEFKRLVGVSPVEYLIRNRMRMARYMLEDRNRSISQVAFALGYYDIFHFSKQFKKRFGIPPTRMRR
jgi:AraC family transcriptional regulator of arabinose operon